ncbi:uncharacterized protein [Miscanthus floridulus]|uniref:uncharacterized protein n=1 Tax=Miscanthus floridulus TaxID=154761 RepID=UPI0034586930
MATRSNNKLSFKLFGTFRILKRIGAVAYLLDLPAMVAVHPIFHVSLLKSSPSSQTVNASLPSELIAFQVPERFLQWCWTTGDHPIHQALVKWSHMPASMSTWENIEELCRQFPRALAWGHTGSQEGGIVSNAPDSTSTVCVNPAGGSDRSSAPSSPRPKRGVRPNPKVFGPMW